MKFCKNQIKKVLAFVLALIFSLAALSGCKNENTTSESPVSDAGTDIKAKIDNLYVSEINRDKELVCISSKKSYTTSGNIKDGSKQILTDGIYAGEENKPECWSVFDYASPVEITVDLGGITENLTYFNIDMMQKTTEKIYYPDEIKVSASLDGTEFVDLGILLRDKTDTDVTSSLYELRLSGGIKAAFIRYTAVSDKKGSAYVDEVNIYQYGTENKDTGKLYTYEPFYGGKMPEKVTQPVFWDKSEADYTKSQNLVLGRTPNVFTMNVDVSKSNNSPASDIGKLTDGICATNSNYNDACYFTAYSEIANTDARLFVFDLEKTSAITGFKTSFIKSTNVGINLPESYSVYTSENGVTWDVLYRRDGIRNGDSPNNSLVTIQGNFDKSYRSRFVAVFFDIEGNTRFDEIEIYGTKSAENAAPVSEKGDTKLFSGKYPQPEDVKGVRDALLLYHCYSNTINGTEPVIGGFTEEQCMTWLAYYDKDMKITDYYFNTFMFLGGGQTTEWNKADMWKVYIDNVFSKGFNLDALNSGAAKVGEALGNSSYKAKVMFTLFMPSKEFTEFGDLDGDGKAEDLSTLEGKQKVMSWQLNEYIRRFNEAGYTNLELAGFYWHDEVIRYDDVYEPAAIRYTADKAHESGYIMMSCPYYLASGYYDWYNLGFDIAFNQPAYFFWNNNDQAIPKTSTIAKAIGMGVEMEVEATAVKELEKLNWYIGYLKGGIDYGYMNAVHMYYYSMPYFESCKSVSKLGRQLYELNYQFVKGTLSFKTSESVYEEVYTCAVNDKVSDKLGMQGISVSLSSSAKYGTVKFLTDGRFTYTPFPGFTGEDSFYIEVMLTGAEKVYYQVKVKVGN